MHEIAIIGGGLAGLALAARLQDAGVQPHLFEARDRLGGRILTDLEGADLGPSWVWPDSQPELHELILSLGLETLPQHDEGELLHLTDPEKGATRAGRDPVHGGAHRVAGGMGQLIAALAGRVGAEHVTLNAVLEQVTDRKSHVLLKFRTPDGELEIAARRMVLALPPRLIAEKILFEPALPESLTLVMRATPTWMAATAKAVVSYPEAFWREEGLSGSAFIAHERAVLSETFDLSGESGVLGGFLGLDPETRAAFATGLPMLIGNQMVQLFGPAAEGGRLTLQDWATEPFICSAADRAAPAADRRAAHPLLRRAFWGGRLHLIGSETARAHPGHMAGALDSADRVAGRLLRMPKADPEADLPEWFAQGADMSFETYQTALTRLLSRQRPEEVTRMAAQEGIAMLLDDALDHVQETVGERERGVALEEAKAELRSALNRVIGQIIGFNRSSCALRAFPEEHALPEGYLRLILADASALGRGFLNDMDALLAARAGEA